MAEPRISTLGFALMGMLAREPRSGYDLAKTLDRPLADLWSARLPQIYPELARLSAAGLVAHEDIAQEGRPDKKVYRLTALGREALGAWAATEPSPVPVRRELLLKTFSIWLARPADAASLYRRQAEAARASLDRYTRKMKELTADGAEAAPGTPAFSIYANLKLGIAETRAFIAWCDWMATEFEGLPPDAPGRARPRKGRARRKR